MTTKPQRTEQSPSPSKRRVKRLCLVGIACVSLAIAIYAFLLLRDPRSTHERLAEFEAARAVPDTQNAAFIYAGLLSDPGVASLLDSHLGNLDKPSVIQKRDNPWRSEDDPELATWIDDCAPILDELLEAARLEACRFPVSIDPLHTRGLDRFAPVLQWAHLLSIAINNDLAEGRLDGAATKWRCLIQMGDHLRQQPFRLDHTAAYGATALALRSMVRFVAAAEPSDKNLQAIEALPLPLADDWQRHLRDIRLMQDLAMRKTRESLSLSKRLTSSLSPRRMKSAINRAFRPAKETPTESTAKRYRQCVVVSRGLHILIALRRHHSQTGQWPQGLHEIKASVPDALWTDPLNGDPFIYRRRENGFELYSKGPNAIDHRARTEPNSTDDVPVWIPPPPN